MLPLQGGWPSNKASVEGPDLAISPEAARALGMIMHELATNAVKHGALSNGDGQVAVGWQVMGQDGSAQLKLVWQEAGGPAVVAQVSESMGLEGIVSKRVDQPYVSDRNVGWVKVKTRSWREANADRHKLFEKARI